MSRARDKACLAHCTERSKACLAQWQIQDFEKGGWGGNDISKVDLRILDSGGGEALEG